MLNGFGEQRMLACAALSKRNLRQVIGICTGSVPLNSLLHKIYRNNPNRNQTDRCRYCMTHPENMLHLLRHCQDQRVVGFRRDSFGQTNLTSDRMRRLEVKDMLKFAAHIGLSNIMLMDRALQAIISDSE